MARISNKLEADPVPAGLRFEDDLLLSCPLFQRRYVWKKKEIDQLWADIDTVIDGSYEKRFLGALVFDDEQASTATKAGRYWIIDGQQRLTTLFLSLVALAAEARELGEAGMNVASDLLDQYLVSKKRETKHFPKLSPTIWDSRQFNLLLREAFPDDFDLAIDQSKETGDDSGAMTNAYRILRRKVGERTSKVPGFETQDSEEILSRLEQLRDVLLEKLEFVEIRLGDAHDPNEVFDRLNNEGVKLGIIDLVRNEVLKRLGGRPGDAEAAYFTSWVPFEEGFSDDNARTGYFFPLALTIEPSATKASTFSELSNHWSELVAAEDDPSQQVSMIMADLERFQVPYNAIHDGETWGLPDGVAEKVDRLVNLRRPSSSYAYIIQLLHALSQGEVEADDVDGSLAILESFLVRRAFLGIEPTGLHAIFKRLWLSAGADPKSVRREITSKTVLFPDDEQFAKAIRTGSLYGRRVAPYVISEYERDASQHDEFDKLPEITIDHVMPQERDPHWVSIVTKEEHEALLDVWGNLVPLSQPANPAKSNRSWQDSKEMLARETLFSTTKTLYDEHETWDARTIEARSERLVEWALDRWPYFGDLLP